jgi:Methyltransferase FkbM domain
MSSIPAQTTPTQIIGNKEHGFPMIENAWDFFSSKGTKTVFISVGTGASPLAELDLLEMMGCPVHIFEPSAANILNWENVKGVLKTRKAVDVKGDFDKEALSKWVLPRNVLTRHELPSFYKGKVELNGESVTTVNVHETIVNICTEMKLQEPRIDILKVDLSGNECAVLDTFLLEGYRPSLILVNWSESPDTCYKTLSAAGNLQMLGYSLVGKNGNKYLYYFTNKNYYEMCSWEEINEYNKNPLVKVLVEHTVSMVKAKTEAAKNKTTS